MTEREKQANANLQKIAKYTQDHLPEGMGFVVLAFEFGMNADENRLMYVSNANRDDVVDAMDEFKEKTREDFGKHKNAENKTWYDLDELMNLNLPDETSIWCLNKHNYTDFIMTIKDLKVVIANVQVEQAQHYQFSVVKEGEKKC